MSGLTDYLAATLGFLTLSLRHPCLGSVEGVEFEWAFIDQLWVTGTPEVIRALFDHLLAGTPEGIGSLQFREDTDIPGRWECRIPLGRVISLDELPPVCRKMVVELSYEENRP